MRLPMGNMEAMNTAHITRKFYHIHGLRYAVLCLAGKLVFIGSYELAAEILA